MDDEKLVEQISEEEVDKNNFISWVKDNKIKLIFAGVGVTALILTIVGLKNPAYSLCR